MSTRHGQMLGRAHGHALELLDAEAGDFDVPDQLRALLVTSGASTAHTIRN